MSGCPWSSVSALCQAVCPCLRLLDLSRVEDLKDSNLRELLAPPNADTRSGECLSYTAVRQTGLPARPYMPTYWTYMEGRGLKSCLIFSSLEKLVE